VIWIDLKAISNSSGFYCSATTANLKAFLFLPLTAVIIIILLSQGIFLTEVFGIVHKAEAFTGTTANGFSNFDHLPTPGFIINSSNHNPFPGISASNTNIIRNTPFAPYANYGQFTSANSAPPTQTPPPYSYPYSYPYQQQNQNQSPYQPQPQQQQPASAPTTGSTNLPQSQYPYSYQNQSYPSSSYPYQNQLSSSPGTNGLTQNPYTSGQYSNQQPSGDSSSLYAPFHYSTIQQGQSQQADKSSGRLSTLLVRTLVNSNNNALGGVRSALGNLNGTNLSELIENVYTTPDGYDYVYHYAKGSAAGVTLNLHPGSYSVSQSGINNNDNNDHISYSGDCRTTTTTSSTPALKSDAGTTNNFNHVYGYGIIKLGETKICVVTNSLPHK
jgi:hypothetical protein